MGCKRAGAGRGDVSYMERAIRNQRAPCGDPEIVRGEAMSETTQAQINGEVRELLNMLEARKQLDAGFKGMGYNILQEKAMRITSQIRRVEKLLDNPPPSLSTVEQPSRPPAVEEARAAQYIAWSYADHECGGKDRGICGACDDRADSILRKFQPIIAAARAEGRQDIQKLSDNFEACAAHNIEWRDRFNRAHAMWADAVAQLADSQRAWDEVSKIMKFTNNDPWLLVGAVKAAVERKLDNKND
jgi:hypothetical protein